MARKNVSAAATVDFSKVAKEVIEVPLHDEVEENFLQYAYLTIEDRALPDARDGLKPVQRRVLYTMFKNGLTPEKSVVKSAKVVGDCMGSYHPHGDSSIYDALVRLAQDFSLSAPLIFPKGNFGDRPGAGAAAARYTECKMTRTAQFMVEDLKEKCVDFIPNYDDTTEEPTILPARFPNLVVNGVQGIAVGFATKLAPHSPVEVIDATKHLVLNPKADLEKIMEFIPGPDFPTGGQVIGLDGIKEAYTVGKGKMLIRADSHIEPLPRGRHSIVFTSFPYEVNSDTVIEQIKARLSEGKLAGVTDVKDLSDQRSGTRFTVDVKAGTRPDTIREALYKLTSLEETFAINAVAIVEGRPKQVGLLEMLQVWIDFRVDTVKARTRFRLGKAEERLHIVEGLLKALANIDAVIKIVRSSADAATAKESLIKKFKIDDVQAEYILGIPLRRLTKYDQIELEEEKKGLLDKIKDLKLILNDDKVLRKLIVSELDDVRKEFKDYERKSSILGVALDEHKAASAAVVEAATVEVEDGPCFLYMNHKGFIVRSEKEKKGSWAAEMSSTVRGQFIAVSNRGRGFRLETLHVGDRLANINTILPSSLARGEKILTITPAELAEGKTGGIAFGTRKGTVKISAPQWPKTSDEFSVIGLADGDEIVGSAWVADVKETEFAFLSSDSSLLVFSADKVRPQGLSGGGMAGIKLAADCEVVAFGVISSAEADAAMVATASDKMNGKQTPLKAYPRKGRATGGVRSQAFLKGESRLIAGAVSVNPVLVSVDGASVALPPLIEKRDASGKPLDDGKLI